jgi:hypothetical protein
LTKVKVVNDKSNWFGQVGEYVSHVPGSSASGNEAIVTVRMAGDRLIEFKASDLAEAE